MQYHHNGFRPGDPEVRPAAPGLPDSPGHDWPEIVDVLIVGAGPAGLLLGAQLAQFGDITTRIVERREEPMTLGQADGVACRTVEMFHAFGLADRLVKEAYQVNETVFWEPDEDDRARITRTGRVQDVEDGLSEFPHLIVNQARLQDFLADHMRRSPRRLEPEYGLQVTGVEVPDTSDKPVTVRMRHRDDGDGDGEERIVRARYVVGADGARSAVRKSIGRTLHGEAQNHAWGVMDILPRTDFPDIRFKSVIKSAEGSILLIPREGGNMVRLYVDLGTTDPADRGLKERVTSEQILDTARGVLAPYSLDVQELVWWSVYEVGQRLTDKFDNLDDSEADRTPQVFIAGDACHTHSAKAGQGMNVSMQDTFNLGWKLAAVLRGRTAPELLHTYSAERQAVAQELIDFDRGFAQMMGGQQGGTDPEHGTAAGEAQQKFTAAGVFTAGFATHYQPSLVTGRGEHQHLATGFPIGKRFHSAPVVRMADGKHLGLGHVHEADGRWRLYAFAGAGDPTAPDSAFHRLCDFLASDESSPLRRFTPDGADVDSVFDVRGVVQDHLHTIDVEQLPTLLLPTTGTLGLKDYEKAFCPDRKHDGEDIFDLRGIDREHGALVVVRPDQYVAHVLPLDARQELADFFAGFMVSAG